MSGSNVKVCSKCHKEYSKKLLFCTNCGTIDRKRADQIHCLEIKAKNKPEIAIQCNTCKAIFPNDQSKCPYCGIQITKNNSKCMSHMRIEDLKKARTPISAHFSGERLNSKKSNTPTIQQRLISCNVCGVKISQKAETCPHCGNPTGIHVCPKCGNTNTHVITETSKAASIFLWGAFAANKVVSKFECTDCGHKF